MVGKIKHVNERKLKTLSLRPIVEVCWRVLSWLNLLFNFFNVMPQLKTMYPSAVLSKRWVGQESLFSMLSYVDRNKQNDFFLKCNVD